jgi:hypothetical protein
MLIPTVTVIFVFAAKIASFTSVKTQEYLKPTISVPIAAGAEERKEKLFVALGVFAGQALF